MTEPTYIQPALINHLEILEELKMMGWKDSKIETTCGFARGYISALRTQRVSDISYHRAVRLWNFWVSEREEQRKRSVLNLRLSSVTT